MDIRNIGIQITMTGPTDSQKNYTVSLQEGATFTIRNDEPYSEGTWGGEVGTITMTSKGAPLNSFNGIRISPSEIFYNAALPKGSDASEIGLNIGVDVDKSKNFLILKVSGGQENTELAVYSNYGSGQTHITGYIVLPLTQNVDAHSVTREDILQASR
ncbi:hypothetical protein [Desulfoluna spongiiphila]|uniref:Uncharacterized protein n=1 Tax=Desulfoluna spongiiphila TaxID=419481 RepID=A0A1G5DAD3_9BACT|nr:hypothetical protein [Desulfoluna spongiiphila]SCY11556.1 hypothetical protein SAMN05216233_10472 [Desulfoluna spongiiphila]